jgi:ABC-type antimicrobial peptide transport system permease subunit
MGRREVDVGAVRMLAWLEIRRRWRRVVVLTLLVGVVGAVVLSSAAGARRSDSALARFNASSRSASLELTVGHPTAAQLRAFGAVEGVESFARLFTSAIMFPGAPQLQAIAAALDTGFGTVVDRARIVAGRAADPNAVDEITIGEALAAQLHLRVGDHLDGESYSRAQIESFRAGGYGGQGPEGPRVRLRIVGIVRRPLDLGDRGAAGGVLVLTPAFNRKYATSIGSFSGEILRVRTRNGAADVSSVAAAARRIFGSTGFDVQDLAIESQGAQNAINVLTVALWVFGGVAALAGLFAIAIVLSREISLTAIDQTTQSALGLTRPQRMAIGGFQGVPVAVGGAILAVLAAAAASTLFPIGVARRAELHTGLRIDGTVLALGTVAIISGILLIAFLAALRTTRQSRPERPTLGRTATVVAAAARAGLTPVATTGVRMALEPGRGPARVPVRSAIVGAAVGILGVVAVLMFTSSLHHVETTPGQYGWTWDFAAIPNDPSVVDAVVHTQGLAAAAAVLTANVQLDGRPVFAWGFTSLRGTIGPEIVAGRPPNGPDEVALGAASLDELGKSIGDSVQGDGPDGSHTFRIVGRAAFPKIDYPQPLANGAVFSDNGFAKLVSPSANNGSFYLVGRVAPGAQLADVERRVAAIPGVAQTLGPSVPVEVDRLRQVNWLPATLGALLAVLALVAVGHALITGVRRHRRELAVLKSLGFDRHQIRATVAWQATTIATVGLIAGIPAGVIIGSLVWRQVANGLGISTTPAVPGLALVLVVPCALAAVNLIAFFPARAAARTRPAVALQAE